ncbi:hypothetical protein [Niveispirillum lacus]|uniref:hypothetical protein n=1 Tax=Niveispirillum lacus TaxID=1981099 RepID=UPI00105432B7|nr:hypothetical protein [Niveispirillum lacus]
MLRLSFPPWRLLLVAAFVLLAGAMGSSGPAARASIAQIAGDCSDLGNCHQRLTAPSQPALIQVALRIDGKALTGNGGGFAALPDATGLPVLPRIITATSVRLSSPPLRNAANGPGQPRGPPTGR